ncbi:uncharacterized protein LOC117179641 [Belonocnema kinseyi]|uniref:uncharacterized protein LOC117179641 n=1 Tax=Belonocnema kinseyi TaxID=2817044 RepID=UPI00143DA873|nr:uncharacterized protein LOC117179641 [Belonocnema kinseyi]
MTETKEVVENGNNNQVPTTENAHASVTNTVTATSTTAPTTTTSAVVTSSNGNIVHNTNGNGASGGQQVTAAPTALLRGPSTTTSAGGAQAVAGGPSGSQPAVTSFAQHFGDPNINANLRWPAASNTEVTHVYNTPLQVPGPKITLGHLLSTLEHIASTQGTVWPHMSQALQHSQRMMEMSLEFQRGEIRRLEVSKNSENSTTHTNSPNFTASTPQPLNRFAPPSNFSIDNILENRSNESNLVDNFRTPNLLINS